MKILLHFHIERGGGMCRGFCRLRSLVRRSPCKRKDVCSGQYNQPRNERYASWFYLLIRSALVHATTQGWRNAHETFCVQPVVLRGMQTKRIRRVFLPSFFTLCKACMSRDNTSLLHVASNFIRFMVDVSKFITFVVDGFITFVALEFITFTCMVGIYIGILNLITFWGG